jgi:F-type H+-transporting ATPase subunit b
MNVLWLMTMISGGGEHKGSLLDIDPGLIFWTAVTFFLLLFFLGKFAWKPIVKTLQEREAKIKDSLDQAEKARREAEALSRKNEELIARAEREAQELMRHAKEAAEKLKTDVVDQAKEEAAKVLETAKKEIDNDKKSALVELRKEVAHMAVAAASKIIATSLDIEKHRKIVDDFIKEMPEGRN